MTTKTEIKELLARAITKIDEWDLVHGCEEGTDELKDIILLLVEGASAVGIDPNELVSLKEFTQEGKYKIVITHDKVDTK